jgi:hypothetical protein
MKSFLSSGRIAAKVTTYRTLAIATVLVSMQTTPLLANGVSDVESCATLSQTLAEIETVQTSADVLANADENSLEGKLYDYQQARKVLVLAVEEQNKAYAAYQEIALLSEEGVTEAYPLGDYPVSLAEAARSYNRIQRNAESAQIREINALAALGEGQQFSDVAMMELHDMLGL